MSTPVVFSPLVVVPVYNHGAAIVATVAGIRAHGVPCLLVDDGSDAGCAAVLDSLAASHADTSLLRTEVLKFQQLVRPGARLALALEWREETHTISFGFSSAVGAHASGRLVFGDGAGG